MLAVSALNTISNLISNALSDDSISDEEYSLILLEFETFTRMKEDLGIKSKTSLNPSDVGRYTGFAQTSLWRRMPVYRHCANFPVASEAGIPAARYVNDRRRTPVYRLCFLKCTGTRMPES